MKRTIAFIGALVCFSLILSAAANADPNPLISPLPSGMLNDVVNQYSAASATWIGTALGWANAIFIGLILLDFAWSLIEVFLQERQLEVFFASLVKRFFFIGTALFILQSTPDIVQGAVSDFFHIGQGIAGMDPQNPITPDTIFNKGIEVSNALYKNISGQSWSVENLESNPQQSAALLVQLAYGSVAAQLLITEIQIFLVIGCGAFLLGFMGTRWTLPYADAYPKMILASGMKLVSITIIVGLGDKLSEHWLKMATPNPNSHPPHLHLYASEYTTIAASALVYGTIALSLPSIMQSFAGASLEMGGRSLLGGASGGAGGGVNTQGQHSGGGGYGNPTTQAQAQDRLKALERAAGPY